MKYSNTTRGFYDITISSNIPNDAVEITYNEWQELLNGQSKGNTISADKDGRPVLIPQSNEQIKDNRTSQIKYQTEDKINAIFPQYKQLNAISRALELVLKKIEGTIISSFEENELYNIRDMWRQISNIREASNIDDKLL